MSLYLVNDAGLEASGECAEVGPVVVQIPHLNPAGIHVRGTSNASWRVVGEARSTGYLEITLPSIRVWAVIEVERAKE